MAAEGIGTTGATCDSPTEAVPFVSREPQDKYTLLLVQMTSLRVLRASRCRGDQRVPLSATLVTELALQRLLFITS